VVAGDADGGVGGEDEVGQSGGQLAVALVVQGDVDAVGRLQATSCRVGWSVDGGVRDQRRVGVQAGCDEQPDCCRGWRCRGPGGCQAPVAGDCGDGLAGGQYAGDEGHGALAPFLVVEELAVPGAGLPPVDVAGEEVVRGAEEVGGPLARCDGRVTLVVLAV